MKIASFMVPRSKLVVCSPDDSIQTAMKKMLDHVIGSVIVIPSNNNDDQEDNKPVGIVTKTDIIRAWERGLDAQKDKVRDIMGTKLETVLNTSPSAVAAEHFETTKHRHAFVMDKNDAFVGIVTAYDIAVEAARDHRAWPYSNRDEIAEKYKVKPGAVH